MDELIRDNVKVAWVDLGEGLAGDYNEDDPDDVSLLRFDVFYRETPEGEWLVPEEGSYCTLMPTDAPDDVLAAGLTMIMDAVAEQVPNGDYKHELMRLSWMEPNWFEEEQHG